VKIYWEKRNYNQVNNWCQELKCNLEILQTEIVKGKKFKTQLKIIDTKGSLPKNIKVYTEGYGTNKKDSKSNAMKKLTEHLIQHDLIQIGIKDWKFLEMGIEELENLDINKEQEKDKEKEKEKLISQVNIPKNKQNLEIPQNKISSSIVDNKIANKENNYNNNNYNNSNPVFDKQPQPNPRKEYNKILNSMINELKADNFENALLLYEELLKRRMFQWGEFAHLWYYSLKSKRFEYIHKLVELIIINLNDNKNSSLGLDDKISEGEETLNRYNNLNSFNENNASNEGSSILGVSQPLSTYTTTINNPNNLICPFSNQAATIDQKCWNNNNFFMETMPASNTGHQNNLNNLQPIQQFQSYPFNPFENMIQQIVFNNFDLIKENSQLFNLNSLNYLNNNPNFPPFFQQTNVPGNYQNITMNNPTNANMINNQNNFYYPSVNNTYLPTQITNIHNSGITQDYSTSNSNLAFPLPHPNPNQNSYPHPLINVNYGVQMESGFKNSDPNSYLNNFNQILEEESSEWENEKFFVDNQNEEQGETNPPIGGDIKPPSEQTSFNFSIQFLEGLYESLLFSDDLGNLCSFN
jgi:hypothetical protein